MVKIEKKFLSYLVIMIQKIHLTRLLEIDLLVNYPKSKRNIKSLPTRLSRSKKTRSIRKVQNNCSLLNMLTQDKGLINKQFHGYMFEKIKRNDSF